MAYWNVSNITIATWTFFIALYKVIALATVAALIGDCDKVPLLFAIEFQGEKERQLSLEQQLNSEQ